MTEVVSNLFTTCADFISCYEERPYKDSTPVLRMLTHFGLISNQSLLKMINTHQIRQEQTIELYNTQDEMLRRTILMEKALNDVIEQKKIQSFTLIRKSDEESRLLDSIESLQQQLLPYQENIIEWKRLEDKLSIVHYRLEELRIEQSNVIKEHRDQIRLLTYLTEHKNQLILQDFEQKQAVKQHEDHLRILNQIMTRKITNIQNLTKLLNVPKKSQIPQYCRQLGKEYTFIYEFLQQVDSINTESEIGAKSLADDLSALLNVRKCIDQMSKKNTIKSSRRSIQRMKQNKTPTRSPIRGFNSFAFSEIEPDNSESDKISLSNKEKKSEQSYSFKPKFRRTHQNALNQVEEEAVQSTESPRKCSRKSSSEQLDDVVKTLKEDFAESNFLNWIYDKSDSHKSVSFQHPNNKMISEYLYLENDQLFISDNHEVDQTKNKKKHKKLHSKQLGDLNFLSKTAHFLQSPAQEITPFDSKDETNIEKTSNNAEPIEQIEMITQKKQLDTSLIVLIGGAFSLIGALIYNRIR